MVEGSTEADVEAITATLANLVSVAEAGDADAWLEYTTEDAVYLIPGMPLIVGATAIRDFVADFLAEWEFSFPQTDVDEVTVSGNIAVYRYSGVATMRKKDGSESFSENRKYMDVYRKEGGRWLLARHMYNAND